MVEEISECEFSHIETKPIAVVDFFAEWCMPCVVQEPIMEELAEKFRGKIHFSKVNVDECNHLAQKFKVLSIPTIVVLKKGQEVERMTGLHQPELLEARIKRFL